MPKAAPAIPEEKKAPEIEENTEEARKKSQKSSKTGLMN